MRRLSAADGKARATAKPHLAQQKLLPWHSESKKEPAWKWFANPEAWPTGCWRYLGRSPIGCARRGHSRIRGCSRRLATECRRRLQTHQRARHRCIAMRPGEWIPPAVAAPREVPCQALAPIRIDALEGSVHRHLREG